MKKYFKIFCFTLSIILVSLVFAKTLNANADTIISWGINPNKNELTPTPPSGSEEILKNNNGFFVGNTNEKKVYLTFDLGYEAGHTAEVLDILKENNIKAIFFLCGNYLKEEALIKRMINEGHSIGNHTDKHNDLPILSEENIKKDIVDFNEKYKSLYGESKISFFRPPQGRFNEAVLKIASENNHKTALWSIAIVDWGKKPINATESSNKIAERLHPGAVILSHITNSGTPKMINQLIPKITEKGYIIGIPDELEKVI